MNLIFATLIMFIGLIDCVYSLQLMQYNRTSKVLVFGIVI